MKNFTLSIKYFLIIFTVLLFNLLTVNIYAEDSTCVRRNASESLDRPQLPNNISTEHFKIHYDNVVNLTYATNTANFAEDAYQKNL